MKWPIFITGHFKIRYILLWFELQNKKTTGVNEISQITSIGGDKR